MDLLDREDYDESILNRMHTDWMHFSPNHRRRTFSFRLTYLLAAQLDDPFRQVRLVN